MSEVAVVEQSPKVENFYKISLSQEDAVSMYLQENDNVEMAPENWGISEKSAKRFNEKTIPTLIEKLADAQRNGDQEAINQAMSELRKYHRKGLIFVDMTTAHIEENGTYRKAEAAQLYDPYTQRLTIMKQTIAVSHFKNINLQVGQKLEELGRIQEFDVSENYIQGTAFDVTFAGNKENETNDRSAHHFTIKRSKRQPS